MSERSEVLSTLAWKDQIQLDSHRWAIFVYHVLHNAKLSATSGKTSSSFPLSRLHLSKPIPYIHETNPTTPSRPATTSSVTTSTGQEILASQRLQRPISPHLGIYRPQITWYASAFNRITGAVLSGGMYAFGAAYLVAPLFGWHLESASLAASFAALPVVAQVLFKGIVAFPFTFHSFNGIRHLVWDTGATITNQQVIYTGWTVVGLSVASALALTFI